MPRTTRSGPAASLVSHAIKTARAQQGISQIALAERLDMLGAEHPVRPHRADSPVAVPVDQVALVRQ